MAKMMMDLTYRDKGDHVTVLTNFVSWGFGKYASYINADGDIITVHQEAIVRIEPHYEDEEEE